MGGMVGWVAHEILVSAQGPLVLVLGLRVWGQGLTIEQRISQAQLSSSLFVIGKIKDIHMS